MISGVDINDWHNQPSVNGKGWEVQGLFKSGWRSVSHTVESKGYAEKLMKYIIAYSPVEAEFRVYEVLG